MSEKISIVIPLYNKENCIVTTLQSVLDQTYTDWECIVVNDGSTDKSLQTVEDFIRGLKIEDWRLKIVSKPNGGVCSARNMGIEVAKGEFVALLDGDDLWNKEYLSEQVKMIQDFPDAAMWGINIAGTNKGVITELYATGLYDGFRGYVENYFEIPGRVSDLFHPSGTVIRKEVFDKIGMFDERIKYAEDSDMWFRINAVYPTAFYDKIMVSYQQDAENRAMNRTRNMRYFLPYYVDKFREPLFRNNSACYQYVNRWCAVHIKQYYFLGDEQNVKDAKIAASKLDYSVLPFKYRLFFKLPYDMAKWLYEWDRKRTGSR